MSSSVRDSRRIHLGEIQVGEIHVGEIHLGEIHVCEIHVGEINSGEIQVAEIHLGEIHVGKIPLAGSKRAVIQENPVMGNLTRGKIEPAIIETSQRLADGKEY